MASVCEVCGAIEQEENEQVAEDANLTMSTHLIHVCDNCRKDRQTPIWWAE